MQNRLISEEQAAFELWQSGRASSGKISPKLVREVIEERLSETQKKYLVSYYFERMKMAEIAEKYGVTKSTVSRTVGRAEKKIRDALKYCVRC